MRKLKKGFTLVELLVVIAILAILATVSVVGYFSFTEKAEVSNDQSLVSQLNTVLKSNSATDGANKYPDEAMDDCEEAGYSVDKLTPTSSGEILYDLANDCFVYLAEGSTEPEYINATKTYDADLWKIYNGANKYSSSLSTNNNIATTKLSTAKLASNSSNYNMYLGEGALDGYTGEITVSGISIDTGKHQDVTIVVTITTSNVVIHTSSAFTTLTVKVETSNATVNHYGEVGTLTDEGSSNTFTLNESGSVVGAVLSNAKLVTSSSANVSNLLTTGNASVTDSSNKVQNTYTSEDEYNSSVNEALEKAQAENFASNPDNANYVARIGANGYETLQGAFDAAKDSIETKVILLQNIISTQNSPVGIVNDNKKIIFDLNGKTISSKASNKGKAGTILVGTPDSKDISTLTIQDSTSSGTITNSNKYGSCIAVYYGNLIINGGSFKNTSTATSKASIISYVDSNGQSNIQINDGTFSTQITFAKESNVEINGGIFGAVKVNGTCSISGGSFSTISNLTGYVVSGKSFAKNASGKYEVINLTDPVVYIGDTAYASIAAAVANASDADTIEIKGNGEEYSGVDIGNIKDKEINTITIDIADGVEYSIPQINVLTNKTLNLTGSGVLKGRIFARSNSTLNITNCTIDYINGNYSLATLVIDGSASLTNCTIKSENSVAIWCYDNCENVTISGGNIYSNWSDVSDDIISSNALYGNAINISSGNITFSDDVIVTSYSERKINEGANRAIFISKGNVNIESGTFTSTAENCIYILNGSEYTNSVVLNISGGTFKFSESTSSTIALINIVDSASNVTVSITGGTFYGFDPYLGDNQKGTSWLAEGYVSALNSDGTAYVVSSSSNNE